MERSIYHDGVEIDEEHLNFTEDTKILGIQRIVKVMGTTGPVEGLVVATDPGDLYKVMLTAGKGYTYGGEYVEIDTDISGIVVSNIVGIDSYVAIKITEEEELNLPHVVTGDLYSTKIVHSYSVMVLTTDQWQALSDRDLYMLVAIVHGSGGIVRGIDITKPLSAEVILLGLKKQPTALTGAQVIVVSSNTLSGIGRLKWDYDTRTLYWKAPSDANYGIGFDIGISGVYKLWDSLSVTYIKVDIDYARLPLSNMEEDVEIINILEQTELVVGAMKDTLHRGLLGTGMPSLRNPHGLTLDDLDPGELQDLNKHLLNAHSPGILGSSGSTSGVVSVYSSTQIRINSIVPGELILSGGKTIIQLADTFVTLSGSSGTYYVWVGEGGRIEVDLVAPDEWYLVLATVVWNGANIVSVTDKRVWGSISPSKQVQMDDKNVVLDPSTIGYTIADSLAMIRYVIKRLIGESTWITTPADTISNIVSSITSLNANVSDLLTELQAHENATFTTSGTQIHGVYMGHGGGFDADMLDGREYDVIYNDIQSALEEYFRTQGYIQSLTTFPSPWYDSAMNVVADDHMQIKVNGTAWYLPIRSAPCTCTCTCQCTCLCTGPCSPCSCKSTCSICHLKI